MDAVGNPYSPGPGLAPPELAGRQAEIDAFDALVGRARAGQVSSPIMLVGLRGVGKTVLLRAFRTRAEAAGWFAISVEGDRGADGQARAGARIARELDILSRRIRRKGRGARTARVVGAIEAFSLSVGLTGAAVSVSTREREKPEFDLELGLLDVAEAVAGGGTRGATGMVILVDELQDLDLATTSALLGVQHQASQRGWPFYVIGAGLPELSGRLAGIRTYTERYAYRVIDRLTDAEAREALEAPARRAGVVIDPAATARIVAEARGYPFFLQTFAYEAWLAGDAGRIDADAADLAIERGYVALDGFFRARWERATRAEREVLRLIAADSPTPSAMADLAARLGKPVGALGPARRSLIDKGLVYAPERGRLAFPLLGLAHYITRQPT